HGTSVPPSSPASVTNTSEDAYSRAKFGRAPSRMKRSKSVGESSLNSTRRTRPSMVRCSYPIVRARLAMRESHGGVGIASETSLGAEAPARDVAEDHG